MLSASPVVYTTGIFFIKRLLINSVFMLSCINKDLKIERDVTELIHFRGSNFAGSAIEKAV